MWDTWFDSLASSLNGPPSHPVPCLLAPGKWLSSHLRNRCGIREVSHNLQISKTESLRGIWLIRSLLIDWGKESTLPRWVSWAGKEERRGGNLPLDINKMQMMCSTGRPRLTTVRLVTVWSNNSADFFKNDLWPLFTFAGSLWSRNQNSKAWQLAHIYDSCGILGSCDPLLRPSESQVDGEARS